MALAPDRRPVRHWWLYVLCIGVLLAACDLTPVLGGRSPARRPVETVTALEINAAGLPVDDPSAAVGRATAPPPGVPDTESR